jgi:prepilin-type N-terminal cleavage/methylation domain-containing protein
MLPRGFTLIELLVVIAIIALLMSILMPALSRVKEQARMVVCLSNMHQWGLIWQMYTDQNGGFFPQHRLWPPDLKEFWKDDKILYCRSAVKPFVAQVRTLSLAEPDVGDYIYGRKHQAWAIELDGELYRGSYGISQWITRDYGNVRDPDLNWKTANVKGANRVPMFLDSTRIGLTPLPQDQPPEFDGQIYFSNPSNIDEIRGFCVNRHKGHVQGAFMDFSARNIGLKELWVLWWHRNWPVRTPEDLPSAWDDSRHWMYSMKDPF